MHSFDLHSEFYTQPIWLTQEEKKKPMTVIKQFFDDVKLIEVRQHLANLLDVAVASDNSVYADARERDAVICFCKQLEKMVKAAQVLSE